MSPRFRPKLVSKLTSKAKPKPQPVTITGIPATHRDQSYGSHPQNLFDIWLADADEPTPLVIHIHGGGFVRGSRSGIYKSPDIPRFLDAGVSFAAVDYRFHDDPASPRGVRDSFCDCRRAVQFLRSKADEWNIDKTRVGVYGGSGGGGASLWLAFHEDMADPWNQDPVLRESTRLTVVGAKVVQATYDLLRWPDILGEQLTEQEEKELYEGAIEAVRFDTVEAIHSCEGIAIRQDLDYLQLMSRDDPPMYVSNGGPGIVDDDLHHPLHAKALWKRAREVGLEARVYAPAIGLTAPCEDLVDFFLWHLLEEPDLCLLRGSRTEEKNKTYVTGLAASNRQKLDLYLPRGDGPFPVVMWVHGGAYLAGNRSLKVGAQQFRLLEHGYALASVDYRLSEEAKFPAQIQDLKAAVRWLRANAAEYKLDPERIGAWGASAGGHLVALLGTTCDKQAVLDHVTGEQILLEDPAMGNPGESSCVQAVVDWFGPVDFGQMQQQLIDGDCDLKKRVIPMPNEPDSHASKLFGAPIQDVPGRVKAANPAEHVDQDAPPFLIMHGRQDCTIPYQQSELLYQALEQKGSAEVTLVLLPTGHGTKDSKDLFSSEASVERVVSFFDRHLKP